MRLAGTTRSACRLAFLLALLLALPLAIGTAHAQPQSGVIRVVELRGVINPPLANYFERALTDSIEQDAQLVVVTIDTPGGLDSSMREIIQEILASPVPVAIYVSPPGSRAASAGLFLLISSHVAAMAPGTNIGAAHPVDLGGTADPLSLEKAENDAAALMRSLALHHERNVEWAEKAVRESVSATEQEALDLGIIDIIADDLDDLLQQLDGRTVQTASGPVTLRLINAPREEIAMTWPESLLHTISDPNIAFLLLSIGGIGIIAELYNPGAFFPGITGVISLLLAFFALGNLPTNWAGVALILLAMVLFVAELYVEGFGALGIGCIVSFLLGGLILFRPFSPASPAMSDLRVSPWLLILSTLILAALLFFVVTKLVRSFHAPVLTGPEQFIGKVVRVHRKLNPRGLVWFDGQTWDAETKSGESVVAGRRVCIVHRDGLTLIVEPIEEVEPGK